MNDKKKLIKNLLYTLGQVDGSTIVPTRGVTFL